MTDLLITLAHANSLKFQTRQLYSSFVRAVTSMAHRDAVWAKKQSDSFTESLGYAFSDSKDKGSEASIEPTRFVLYWAICWKSTGHLVPHTDRLQSEQKPLYIPTETTVDDLVRAIDNPELDPEDIRRKTSSLALAHRYDGIVAALNHVNDKYY